MNYLDDLAFKLFGPGSNGKILLLAGVFLVLLVALLGVLWMMLAQSRAPAGVRPRKLKKKVVDDDDDDDDLFLGRARRERRIGARRSGNPIAIHFAENNATEDAETGWIQDRSTGGLGLEVERDLPVNTIIKIRPVNAAITTPWIELQVRNCRRAGNRYLVGCRFTRTPSWDVMMAFG